VYKQNYVVAVAEQQSGLLNSLNILEAIMCDPNTGTRDAKAAEDARKGKPDSKSSNSRDDGSWIEAAVERVMTVVKQAPNFSTLTKVKVAWLAQTERLSRIDEREKELGVLLPGWHKEFDALLKLTETMMEAELAEKKNQAGSGLEVSPKEDLATQELREPTPEDVKLTERLQAYFREIVGDDFDPKG
jgi:hypothetical protein